MKLIKPKRCFGGWTVNMAMSLDWAVCQRFKVQLMKRAKKPKMARVKKKAFKH